MPRAAARPSRARTVPWPDEAIARYLAKGYWEGRPLGAHMYAAADANPDAVCLTDGRVRLTYHDLMTRADGAARRLRALGLRADDRVVLQLPNCWEFVVLTVACFRLGVVPVMALPAHRFQEISAAAALTEARALIVPGTAKGFDFQEMAARVVAEVPTAEHVLVLGTDIAQGNIGLRPLCEPADDADAARAELDAIAPDATAIALLLLSGGTTGLPKLIARTHNDYAYFIKRSAQICDFGRDTVYLAVLPLAHGYPMAGPGLLGTLFTGGRVVIASSPASERAFKIIERERVTVTSLVPAVVQRWLESYTAVGGDLSSLRLMQVAGSRLADEIAHRVTPVFGCTLQQGYGMSEGLYCLTRPDDPVDVICQTQGRPICPDDELMVVNDAGEPVAPGKPGVLLTRGPYTVRSYYHTPELSARAFVGDGWYRTGDIVLMRADGNLCVQGRDKDVINRGGEKISAEEIENFTYQVGGVSMAAAVGMPDAELGERVCLFVVPHPGQQVSLAETRTVMEQAGVAHFKLPDRLILVSTLPVTSVGKVDKKALRAEIGRMLE